jgi:PKHD-type hydroxylase
MILSFAEVIDAAAHAAILAEIAAAQFVDGRETAGVRLAGTKRNLQIGRDDPATQRIGARVLAALKEHTDFRAAVYPSQLHSVLVSRYLPGMEYGAHVDDALMGQTAQYRADLSLTLFLSPADGYDGGELALESGSGEVRVKLPARGMVCYPTGQLHRVLPVTRGERLAVVGWIQSHVREASAREALWDLAQARDAVFEREGKSRAFDLINKTHTNLLRRWAEP